MCSRRSGNRRCLSCAFRLACLQSNARRHHGTCAAHRAWVRKHCCSVRGCRGLPIECAHVRNGTDGGLGLKPSDKWTISLCRSHHLEQHELGEPAFEARYELNLRHLAKEFAQRSPYLRKAENNVARSSEPPFASDQGNGITGEFQGRAWADQKTFAGPGTFRTCDDLAADGHDPAAPARHRSRN